VPTAPAIHQRTTAKAPVHGHVQNRQATREYNTNSKAWKAIRREVLARDRYLCQSCRKYGDQVDHIDGDSCNNPRDGSNWQTLCKRCHSSKTARETWHGAKGRAQ